jgi:hypothetical protein
MPPFCCMLSAGGGSLFAMLLNRMLWPWRRNRCAGLCWHAAGCALISSHTTTAMIAVGCVICPCPQFQPLRSSVFHSRARLFAAKFLQAATRRQSWLQHDNWQVSTLGERVPWVRRSFCAQVVCIILSCLQVGHGRVQQGPRDCSCVSPQNV